MSGGRGRSSSWRGWFAGALLAVSGCAAAPSAPVAPPGEPAAALASAPDPRFAAAIAYSEIHAGRALLIRAGDEIAVDVGQNGHAAGAAHPLHGASEAFWGVLGAAADGDGMLDLDEPVAFTIPEFEADPRRREMRLRHLLHLTSGLESGLQIRIDAQEDAYARALELEMISRPGERFQYGPSHLLVFGEVLRRKLAAAGQEDDPLAYLERRLLEPIGIRVEGWERDAAGNPDVAGGARLAAREWAKLGRLLAQTGRWQGHRLIEEETLRACFRGSEANPSFGLALWLNPGPEAGPRWTTRDARVGARSFAPGLSDLVVASGLNNQRLYVIPSLDLVAVRFGGRDRSFRDEELLAKLLAGAQAKGS